MDTLNVEQRSKRMSLVRSRDTKPEWRVRRLVHGMGYRYRLHYRKLPGCPDLVFVARRKVIFVHGCFWHRHAGCPRCRLPKSRLDFWKPKLEANRQRDRRSQRELRKLGWQVMVIWECETTDSKQLAGRIRKFMEDNK